MILFLILCTSTALSCIFYLLMFLEEGSCIVREVRQAEQCKGPPMKSFLLGLEKECVIQNRKGMGLHDL